MSLTNEQKLSHLAAKYLNYQEFANTVSKHTSKSYANDLNQLLRPQANRQLIFTEGLWAVYSEKSERIENIEKDTSLMKAQLDVTFLKALVRQAQGLWSPLSIASKNRKNATLKSFFKWLHAEGLLAEDLGAQIICPKVPQKVPHFLSLDEVLSLVQSLKKSKAPTKYFELALILLLYGAGLRVSEACHLRWDNIDLANRTLRVKGKGGKERQVAMVQLLVVALQKLPRSPIYVFSSLSRDKQSPLDTRKAYEIVRTSGVQAGLLRPLHPHALRHSFATHMLSSGTDLRILQELLGHESLTATQKYLHLSIDNLSRTMEATHPLGRSKIGRTKNGLS